MQLSKAPYNLVANLFHLNGEPFDVRSYPYLEAIYNTSARRVCLFTSRQVAKCCPISTQVLVPDGSTVSIGELKVGDAVVSSTSDYRTTVGRVSTVFPRSVRPCVRVTTRSGVTEVLSVDHRVLVVGGEKPAAELHPGDGIASLTRLPPVDTVDEVQSDELAMVAYFIGGGCCATGMGKVYWLLTSPVEAVIARVETLTGCRRKPRAGSWGVWFGVTNPWDARLREWGLAGKYAHEKVVPERIFKLSARQTAEFLGHLWDTDGCISLEDSRLTITYTSVSRELVDGVRRLLLKLGILAWVDRRETHYIKDGVRFPARDAYVLRVIGRHSQDLFYALIQTSDGRRPVRPDVQELNNRLTIPLAANALLDVCYAPRKRQRKQRKLRTLYDIGLRSTWEYNMSAQKFAAVVKFLEEEQLLTGSAGTELKAIQDGELWWDHVVSVEPVGDMECVDIEVAAHHNFALASGIVVHNSTTLASKLVLQAIMRPRTASIYLAPLADQADVFSIQRLRDFTINSPFVKKYFFSGPKVVDQVHRKVFSNDSILALSYAQRTADRVRGRSITSGGSVTWDEIQDIIPDVIPIVEELAFRAKDCSFWYCGTPKSLNNHMEAMRAQSTGCEWAVRCQATGCKKWNLEWDERNIGNTGVICRHCGKPLDTNADGRWVARHRMDLEKGRDSKVDRESYRIPQLIVKPIMDDKVKWLELLGKLKNYDKAQFDNEVLGLPADSGEQPITLDQLKACCKTDRRNELPLPAHGSFPPLVMGVDWAVNGGINAGNSFTTVVIGGWHPFPVRFEIFYWKVFKGHEAGPEKEIEWILRTAQQCDIRLIAADWGSGQVQNIALSNALGENVVCQMWHAGNMGGGVGGKAPRAKWEPNTRKYHLARTRVLTDTFESFRRRQVTMPRAEDCEVFFDHMLAVSMEFNEKSNTQRYVNIKPDDCLHATTYAMLGGELMLNGGFTGHAGTEPIAPNELVRHLVSDDGWPVDDSFYGE